MSGFHGPQYDMSTVHAIDIADGAGKNVPAQTALRDISQNMIEPNATCRLRTAVGPRFCTIHR